MQEIKPKTSRKRRWLILAGVIAVGAPFLFFRNGSAKPQVSVSSLVPVAAEKVERQDLWREEAFDAEFRPYQEIELHAKVTGFLDTIGVDIGDQVKEGQLLATLEIPELNDDLEHAKAVEKRSKEEVRSAQANDDAAHLIYTRLLGVDKAQPHLVAQQEIDTARSKDLAAQAALAAAQEQVDVAQADVKKLNTMLAYSRIEAPFDGVITKRYMDPGALVQGGTSSTMPLVRLSQNSRLRLDFLPSMSFVSLIKIGDPVEVRVASLNRVYKGKVARFTRRIDFETRTMEIEVDVPNPDLTLVPGMFASAVVRVDHREHALAVPVQAVVGQQHPSVYVINKDGVVEERSVKLGLETPDKWEVLSGVRENELVLVGDRGKIQPGQKVSPKVVNTTLAAAQ